MGSFLSNTFFKSISSKYFYVEAATTMAAPSHVLSPEYTVNVLTPMCMWSDQLLWINGYSWTHAFLLRGGPNTHPLNLFHFIIKIFTTLPVRHSTAISYPSIENLFNGCQGHPLFCLPPGTAQQQLYRIKKGSNAQQFIQLTVVGDINAKSGWSLKTEKIRLLWHVYIDTTHTLRHLFPTWTSLYLSTFLKT
jgi:hypothetical protein